MYRSPSRSGHHPVPGTIAPWDRDSGESNLHRVRAPSSPSRLRVSLAILASHFVAQLDLRDPTRCPGPDSISEARLHLQGRPNLRCPTRSPKSDSISEGFLSFGVTIGHEEFTSIPSARWTSSASFVSSRGWTQTKNFRFISTAHLDALPGQFCEQKNPQSRLF